MATSELLPTVGSGNGTGGNGEVGSALAEAEVEDDDDELWSDYLEMIERDANPEPDDGDDSLLPQVTENNSQSLGTESSLVPSDSEVTDEEESLPDFDFILDQKKLFETHSCGCHLPKWKGVEWRDQENGHRYLRYVGMGVSRNNKPTKRRKYGKYYTHRALELFVENDYASELETFRQKQAFRQSKRRSKA